MTTQVGVPKTFQGNSRRTALSSSTVSTLSVFSTRFGWNGLLGEAGELISIHFGYPDLKTIQSSIESQSKSPRFDDWNPKLKELFEAYSEGEIVDFWDVEIRLPLMTEFQRKIINETRKIPYGQTISYGELAANIGHPGAARAVGTVMSNNRFPVLIPCHRVLAAGGKLGGYSSPAGLQLKQSLLDMEFETLTTNS